jgi:hypothetical protein
VDQSRSTGKTQAKTTFSHCHNIYILYINSVSLFVRQSVEVLKRRSLLIKLSPRTRGPKNYSRPQVLTSYFYFYVCFRVATVVIDGGDIFGIWRVGEEIWMRFFWAKGLGGSCFYFFRGGGRGWGWGSRGLNRWKWTGVGNAKDWVRGLCTRLFIRSFMKKCLTNYCKINADGSTMQSWRRIPWKGLSLFINTKAFVKSQEGAAKPQLRVEWVSGQH